MIKTLATSFIWFMAVGFCCAPAEARKVTLEGTGETVALKAGRELQRWKFFWSSAKGRLENSKTVLLIDTEKSRAYILNSAKKVYAELPPESARGLEVYNNPCKDDSELRRMPDMVCKKAGTQTVNGRSAVKWLAAHAQFPDEPMMTVYLDAKLGIVLRKERDDRVEEILNFKEERQPATIFEIPEGFKKVSQKELAASFQ